MKVLGCDRKCESCPLLELYEGLEQYGVKGYRCPMAGCELKAPALKRISEKVKELFPGVEWGGDLERIRKMLGRKKKRVKALVESAFEHYGKNVLYEEQFIKYFKNQGMSKNEVDKLWFKAGNMKIMKRGVKPIFRVRAPWIYWVMS